MSKYNLKLVSDEEWLCKVPDELLPLYSEGSWIGMDKDNHFERKEFTNEEVTELKIKYPEWFINE